jgi:hypothetical protein
MNLCSSKYPKMAQRYLTGEEDVPELWRDRYFVGRPHAYRFI